MPPDADGRAISMPISRLASDPAQSRNPTQSSGATAARIAGTIRAPTTKASTPSGMLIKKIQCQLATVTIQPPSSGAITGASSAGQVR